MPLLTELENIILGLQATNITPLTGLGETPVPRRLPRRQASQRRRREISVATPHQMNKPRWGGIFGGIIFRGCLNLRVGIGPAPEMPLLTELENYFGIAGYKYHAPNGAGGNARHPAFIAKAGVPGPGAGHRFGVRRRVAGVGWWFESAVAANALPAHSTSASILRIQPGNSRSHRTIPCLGDSPATGSGYLRKRSSRQ